MKLLKTSVLSFIALGLVNASLVAEPQFVPVVSGLFTTGQWYFDGDESSMGGNAFLTVVPAVKFSDKFSLVPILTTNYRGTISAEDLAGGNNLFQDTWTNSVSLKGVRSLGKSWKIRARGDASVKFYRETTDEKMGTGLYDHRIFTLGAETEYAPIKRFFIAVGYDLSALKFPNYTTLESAQSDDLSREYAGDNALDQNIQLLSSRALVPFYWMTNISLQGFYSPRDYTDQNVVLPNGLFSQTSRKDTYSGVSIAFERPFRLARKLNMFANINYGYSANDSNQNHYDARQTTFVDDFYSYDQDRIGAQLSFSIGTGKKGPMVFDAAGIYTKRDYRNRPIQNSQGSFLNEKLYTKETAGRFAYSYPLNRNFRLKVSTTFSRSKSNNDYEQLYRYNFNTANYQFGFTYDY